MEEQSIQAEQVEGEGGEVSEEAGRRQWKEVRVQKGEGSVQKGKGGRVVWGVRRGCREGRQHGQLGQCQSPACHCHCLLLDGGRDPINSE